MALIVVVIKFKSPSHLLPSESDTIPHKYHSNAQTSIFCLWGIIPDRSLPARYQRHLDRLKRTKPSNPGNIGKVSHYRECRLDLGKGDCSPGVEGAWGVILDAVLFVSDVDEPALRCSMEFIH